MSFPFPSLPYQQKEIQVSEVLLCIDSSSQMAQQEASIIHSQPQPPLLSRSRPLLPLAHAQDIRTPGKLPSTLLYTPGPACILSQGVLFLIRLPGSPFGGFPSHPPPHARTRRPHRPTGTRALCPGLGPLSVPTLAAPPAGLAGSLPPSGCPTRPRTAPTGAAPVPTARFLTLPAPCCSSSETRP